MAEYETLTQNEHTYKRRKGSRDRWVDERGNVVDLTRGKRTVTQSSSNRLGSGDNSANPNVWIKDGKAYKDDSQGGYKTTYYNAVKKLGQNLGWDVKAGSKSAQALKQQNAALNAGHIKTVKDNTAHIGKNGKATVIKPTLQKKSQASVERPVQNSEGPNPNTVKVSAINELSYLPAIYQPVYDYNNYFGTFKQGGVLSKKYFI